MKLTKNTSKQIKKWLAQNGFDCGCRLGKEFLFEPNDNYIMIAKKYDNFCDDDFMKCLRKLGLKQDFDCITLSILHELGHYNTMDDFTSAEWENDNYNKFFLLNTIQDQHELNVKYWECDTEKVANEWLVDFANEYPKECQKLENIIEKELLNW